MSALCCIRAELVSVLCLQQGGRPGGGIAPSLPSVGLDGSSSTVLTHTVLRQIPVHWPWVGLRGTAARWLALKVKQPESDEKERRRRGRAFGRWGPRGSNRTEHPLGIRS